MTLTVTLSTAPPPHKYKAIINTGTTRKTVRFGARGYQDFTTTQSEQAKRAYIARHKVREDWKNYNTSGFWAKHILWNKPSIQASIKATEQQYNMKIIKR